ncbi:hypothetical protein [Nocardia lijiangensis]|uniref:hypothetical protein n=1 Tax=Nocardia lijiangensis TaxID=299618 RepID=UPI00082EDCEE|nr:hypothetical protein [Nocardia lijiangensis]
MERLSYIDEHAREVDANRDRTWKALLRVVCKDPYDPATVPSGFVLDAADEPARLAMHGEHWFSRYELIFELDDEGPSRTRVRAVSRGDFPGLHGKIYRALVVGSGGHAFIVRRMLGRIAAAA